ncbi:DNA gyrase subunit A [Proteocatella sphenisci]|uniref:DNA gyrase subunit A n=1 Tax=Proteocatella sphenisci TaxID=181070 RepID=UPI000490E7EF|nr:DNA gyrase subunit A [Proteocatella sphenisci]
MNTSKNIVDTLKDNYMPYAMSVIVSRAIPQIDGLKPSHRKLLYTMYKMNLQKGNRTKSANIVGQTMKLNPHGDQAIYETMVRMTKGNEALLYPYVDSKGNFGKNYSRDMKAAAARYTEAKLMDICEELFSEVDKDTVDFADNYDSTMKEPTLLPVRFPNILVNPNKGIAVGMASSIPSFNLSEMCRYTIAFMENEDTLVEDYVIAPDFPYGGEIIYDPDEMKEIFKYGRGSFKIRSKYRVDKKNNFIEVYEIPYTTNVEVIIEKVIELIKAGKIKEISDIRDETDLNGLKITIEYKKSANPDKLMTKLFKMTALEDSFGCNFNILINNRPKVMGVKEIISNWVDFRRSCILRRTESDIGKRQSKLNLLLGLEKIILDIDTAIKIIRNAELEKDVIPALMSYFDLNKEQADYISEIKLRNLNKEYILKRLAEIKTLKEEIAQGHNLLNSKKLQNKNIEKDLKDVMKKYSQERKTTILVKDDVEVYIKEDTIEDYAVNLYITEHNYFKKITDISLRGNSEQKFKDDDALLENFSARNNETLWGITNKANLYQIKLHEFADTKSSNLGDFLPNILGFEQDELIVKLINPNIAYKYIALIFENGKIAKVNYEAYITKGFRKKLQKVYSEKSKLIDIIPLEDDKKIYIKSSTDRYSVLNTSLLSPVSSRISPGVQAVKLIKNDNVVEARLSNQDENIKSDTSPKLPKTMKKL